MALVTCGQARREVDMVRTGQSLVLALCASALIPGVFAAGKSDGTLDGDLASVLSAAGFSGQIEQTFQTRLQVNLGRPIDPRLADLGRMLWFDTRHSLHQDNTC